jgi:CARDB
MKKGVFTGVVMMVFLLTLAIGLTEAQAQPDLKVMSLTVQAYTAGGSKIFITDVTKNRGTSPAGATFTCYFLSSTTSITGATLLGSRYVPPLDPGAKNTGTLYVSIPDVSAGTYHIIARADYAPELSTPKLRKKGYVAESIETNNQLSKSIVIYASTSQPDLTISSLTAPGSANAGQDITVGDTTTNSGLAGVLQTVTKFYLSADGTSMDVLLGSRLVPSLSAGSGSSGTTNVTIPAATVAGSYYILAVADSSNIIMESNESNNTMSKAITILAP